MTYAIVRGIHLVEAIKQDSLNYNYPPMPIPYPCQWWHSVSAVQGKYERLRSFTNSYCDNEGKIKEKKEEVSSGRIFSHVVSSLRILSTYTSTVAQSTKSIQENGHFRTLKTRQIRSFSGCIQWTLIAPLVTLFQRRKIQLSINSEMKVWILWK